MGTALHPRTRCPSAPACTDLPWIDRIAQSFERHSFVGFHRRELPRLIERHGHLVARDLGGALAWKTTPSSSSSSWTTSRSSAE
jgi:hypothetical protein